LNFDNVISVRSNKTIYRDGDKCIKMYNPECSKVAVLNAALNQARIEAMGLGTPKLIEVTTVDGKTAIISEYIEGKSLAQLMEENPDKRDEYMELFVDLQMEIHSKTCSHLNPLRHDLDKKILASDLNATTRYDLHARVAEMARDSKVCHGEYSPDNVIISESGKPYILDWAYANQGNALADAAKTYLLFWLKGDITGAKKYLNIFCEKNNTDIKSVQRWIPVMAVAQSVDCDEKEREFLLSLVNAGDYK